MASWGEGNDCWLVKEHFPSASLATMGPLPASQVAAIGAQVADALTAAHAADVVHRDITPGNILVGADGAGTTHHAIGLAVGSTGAHVSGNTLNPDIGYEVGIDDSSRPGYEGPQPGGDP